MEHQVINTAKHIWIEVSAWIGLISTSLFNYCDFNSYLLSSGVSIVDFDLMLKISEMIVQWLSSIYACVKIIQWVASLKSDNKSKKIKNGKL